MKQLRGVTLTDKQYDLITMAQSDHDSFCKDVYSEAEDACEKSQERIDELWRKICEDGFGK